MTGKKINEITALLPMKAHSSRVKGKNFRNFNGKPLYQWILGTLLSIEMIDRIVINTDAKPILNDLGLPSSEKLVVRERKPEICGDEVSMNLVLKDDVENTDSDHYLMTHTTNPLLSAQTIKSAIETYQSEKCDSLFTVNRYQTRFYDQQGKPINHSPKNLIPTQDLEPWFEENSNLYIFERDAFLETKSRIGLNPVLFETPKQESIDIDEEEDWDLAEIIMKAKIS